MSRLRANAVAGQISTAGGITAAATAFDSAGLADAPAVVAPDILAVTFYTTDTTGRVTAKEIAYITAHTAAATTATITRGQEGTTAQVWALSTSWAASATAQDLTSALRYQGAWSAVTAFAANDVVSDAYGLYAALAAVPAGALYEPVTLPTYIVANPTTVAAVTAPGTNTTGSVNAIYESFVVGASNLTVDAIQLTATATLTANTTIKCGIATAIGTDGTTITWLGATPATITPPASGVYNVSLPASLTLTTGATYYLVIKAVTGDLNNISYQSGTASATVSGDIASQGGQFRSNPSGAAWAAYGFPLLFALISGKASYWQKLASAGNQQNAGLVAASGAAVTIPDPEVQPYTRVVLTANCTVTLPTVTAGKTFRVTLAQDATGSRTVTWSANVIWPGGATPTQTATALKADVYEFYADGSANWLGRVVGQNY